MADFKYCKLEIFIPETHLTPLQAALRETDAGHIGGYDCCLSYSPVTGCWRPLEGTAPYLGSTGQISAEPELKVEVTCLAEQVDETVEAVRRVHPYEEPVINVIPLYRTGLCRRQDETVMDKRERIIRLWFDMWLQKSDLGITEIFSKDAVYIESWGPEYRGSEKIKQWFDEWNTRGAVLEWEIKQYFHRERQTAVEWFFKNQMADGGVQMFDGVSLVQWTRDNKIHSLKEFGCNVGRYDPYQDGPVPRFREESALWF